MFKNFHDFRDDLMNILEQFMLGVANSPYQSLVDKLKHYLLVTLDTQNESPIGVSVRTWFKNSFEEELWQFNYQIFGFQDSGFDPAQYLVKRLKERNAKISVHARQNNLGFAFLNLLLMKKVATNVMKEHKEAVRAHWMMIFPVYNILASEIFHELFYENFVQGWDQISQDPSRLFDLQIYENTSQIDQRNSLHESFERSFSNFSLDDPFEN